VAGTQRCGAVPDCDFTAAAALCRSFAGETHPALVVKPLNSPPGRSLQGVGVARSFHWGGSVPQIVKTRPSASLDA
jgi:hypothetical protein